MSALNLTVELVNGQTIVTAPGIQGPPGVQGEIGDIGETGPVGPQGNSFMLMGTLPAGVFEAPEDPSIGDTWIAGGVITGDVTAILGDGITWTGTLWENRGQLRGPIGPTGETGPAGPVQIMAGADEPLGLVEMTGPGFYFQTPPIPPKIFIKVTPGTSNADWL